MSGNTGINGPRRLVLNARTVTYGIAWFLIFAFTIAELGLTGNQLHKYGGSYDNYPSHGYKHALGLLLFAATWSLVIVLAHPWISVGLVPALSLLSAIFFGTGAGLIHKTSPFRGSSCDLDERPLEAYPANWWPQVLNGECGRVVGIQGLGWALWVLYLAVGIATLVQKIEFRPRPTPEGFYHSKP